MSNYLGLTIAPTELNEVSDPNTGDQIEAVYKGPLESMAAVRQQIKETLPPPLPRMRLSRMGDLGTLRVYFGEVQNLQPLANQAATEEWEITSSLHYVDLLSSAQVASTLTQAQIERIDEALKTTDETERNANVAKFSADAFALKVYQAKLRGDDSIPERYPVLRFTRNFSSSFTGRARVDLAPTVYTTASLITAFNIPAVVQGDLPADPATTPPNKTWAWLETNHSRLRGLRSNRYDEVREWEFRAYDDFIYTVT